MGYNLADAVKLIQRQLHLRLFGDGQKMQHRIAGAADGHVRCNGIAERIQCQNIAWLQILLHHLDNLHTGTFCQSAAIPIHSRDGAVARQCHTQHLSQAVHRIRCIHTGAAAATRTGRAGNLLQFFLGDLAAGALTYHLKRPFNQIRRLSFVGTGQHRTAADIDSWNIQTGCCH